MSTLTFSDLTGTLGPVSLHQSAWVNQTAMKVQWHMLAVV
jgi:hypothetical protein